MAYNKTTWVNGSVPADEDHLNNIENGIEGATQDAENAQSSADKAQESADNAQSTAEEAQSAADKAQETAESANTAAGDAQSAAEAAQETADSANTAVSSEVTARQSADSDLEEKIQENTDLIDSLLPSDAMCYRGELTSSDDLNDLFTTGIYRFASSSIPVNAPISNASIVIVFNAGALTTLQICVRFNSSSDQTFVYRAYHNTSGGTWRPWMQITAS